MRQILRRFAGLLIGFGYDVILVFLLFAMTVNSAWGMFFIVTSLIGTFYPIIGFLIVDLRPTAVKAAFIALFVLQIFIAWLYLFAGGHSDPFEAFEISEFPVSSSVAILLACVPQMGCIAYFLTFVARNGFFDRRDEFSKIDMLTK